MNLPEITPRIFLRHQRQLRAFLMGHEAWFSTRDLRRLLNANIDRRTLFRLCDDQHRRVRLRTANGWFEEEAVVSYTRYLEEIDAGRIDNVPAPAIAIDYWQLPPDARLREVVIAVRHDEAGHRDVNHSIAGQRAHTVPITDAL